MADITITAANVKAGGDAITRQGVAGESITAGQAVTLSTAGKFVKSDNDATGLKDVVGIALHAASADQPLTVQTGGSITIGATLTAGTAYYLSATAGGICPVADLVSGKDVILIGLATSTTVLQLRITDTGVTL